MRTIKIPKPVLGKIRRRALRAFPREVYGYVLGRIGEDRCEVVDVFFPRRQYATVESVSVDADSYLDAMALAASRKAGVIGSLHSHTYDGDNVIYDPVPSVSDFQATADWELVIGVVNVYRAPDASRRVCGEPFFVSHTKALEVVS